ncbi:MAG: hypothetical protein JXA55_07310 [Bacteroidales bacterium]|nr:hypothetical protein [Bacteroidales bacterium]
MRKEFLFILMILLSPELLSQVADNEADTVRKNAVKIFLDCNRCDMNHIRQEIPYINYVRDVHEAQVYILETHQNTGSGGDQYTYTFDGHGVFEGMRDTLVLTTSPDQTSTITRDERTKMLEVGLLRFVARTPLISEITIQHKPGLDQEEVTDRWNNWVFELSTEPRYESEETNKELNLRNSVNISKITPDLKLEIELDQFYNREKFIENADTDSSTTNTYINSSKSLEVLFVKSLGEHWSAGFLTETGSSSRENYRINTTIMPSIEYDIFPYSESTYRQLRIMYSLGYQYSSYVDTTILNKLHENLSLQMLNVAFQVQKKWGSVNMALTASNYLHDFSKNRIELNSSVRIRLFKGLSLEINGGVAHINDQVNLKKGDISEAERLLRLTELATKYRLRGGIEITYTFGSIYNNIVNPRFNSTRFYF